MTPAAIFSAGVLAGALGTILLAIIGIRTGDRLDKPSDDLTDRSGAGGGKFINHNAALTALGDHDHG